jgi:hypothetical protein
MLFPISRLFFEVLFSNFFTLHEKRKVELMHKRCLKNKRMN